jgi:peptidoglycan-associated lipoprotein
MRLKRLLTIAATASVALALAACSSNVKLDENAEKGAPIEDRSAGSASSNDGSMSTRAVNPVEVGTTPTAVDPLNDPSNPLSKRAIYFDFDSFVVKDEYRPIIEAHARYLIANKGRKVVLQGNTDERGTREYNLALGQKRAEAVRKALMSLGVPDAQLEAVSFGKEKPKATGSDDAAYAENRRTDIAYP